MTWQETVSQVEYIAGDLEIDIEYIQPWHLRLIHPDGKRLDFFPKSGRATWVSSKKWFNIPDIELFLYKEFKS